VVFVSQGLAAVTVAPWTLSVQPTCTPRVGHSARFGAELGVHWEHGQPTAQEDRRTMRRGAPPQAASTQQILELRDLGLTWTEMAEQVGMTASGAWSRYKRAGPTVKIPTLGPLAAGSRRRP
jgi:hypothetical protein